MILLCRRVEADRRCLAGADVKSVEKRGRCRRLSSSDRKDGTPQLRQQTYCGAEFQPGLCRLRVIRDQAVRRPPWQHVRSTPQSGPKSRCVGMSALCQQRTHAPQQTNCTAYWITSRQQEAPLYRTVVGAGARETKKGEYDVGPLGAVIPIATSKPKPFRRRRR
jgi:hypothetical protein